MPSLDCPALGIDIGTTNTKVALAEIGTHITVRAVASAPTPQPDALLPTLGRLVNAVVRDRRPQAVGIASMAETGVPLDATGAPLGEWLRWDGHRARAEATGLARRLGWAELVAATGARPTGKVPLATWAWLHAHDPDRFAAMTRWAGAADLACHLLTGRLVTDHTLAGRTMAYRLPDPDLRPSFDVDLLAEVGLKPDALPEVVSGGVAGTARTLLAGATPVVVAGHDHAVGAYAAGVRDAGQVADSVGTAEAVLSVVAQPLDPVPVGRAGMSSVVTVDARHRAVLGGSPAAGALVQWWLEHEAPDTAAEALFAAAAALGDEPADVVVLPYLHGRQAPAPDPHAQLRIVGRRAEHTPARLARALLDGLCLQARWLVDEQHRLAGGRPESVVALGGPLAANPAWLRVKALAAPAALRFVTEPEAVAAGAALVAAARAGLVDPDGVALPTRRVDVSPSRSYDRAAATFVAAATDRRGEPA